MNVLRAILVSPGEEEDLDRETGKKGFYAKDTTRGQLKTFGRLWVS